MNWMGYRKIYLAISLGVIVLGMASILTWGMLLGIDFAGGGLAQYSVKGGVDIKTIEERFKSEGIQVNSISVKDEDVLLRFPETTLSKSPRIVEILKEGDKEVVELRLETVGASFGPELVQKTIYAILISAGVILIWVAFQFKSIKFGGSAVIAMLHDSLVLLGLFSILGHFFGAEVDFLFVTAILTTLSFSVHDTIVVYDRIRENQTKEGGDLKDIANLAVSETMVRSLNNSFTIVFMLLALLLFGGVTVKWFAAALFIGVTTGTYSSPFVAVPVLVTWDEVVKKLKK